MELTTEHRASSECESNCPACRVFLFFILFLRAAQVLWRGGDPRGQLQVVGRLLVRCRDKGPVGHDVMRMEGNWSGPRFNLPPEGRPRETREKYGWPTANRPTVERECGGEREKCIGLNFLRK